MWWDNVHVGIESFSVVLQAFHFSATLIHNLMEVYCAMGSVGTWNLMQTSVPVHWTHTSLSYL